MTTLLWSASECQTHSHFGLPMRSIDCAVLWKTPTLRVLGPTLTHGLATPAKMLGMTQSPGPNLIPVGLTHEQGMHQVQKDAVALTPRSVVAEDVAQG